MPEEMKGKDLRCEFRKPVQRSVSGHDTDACREGKEETTLSCVIT